MDDILLTKKRNDLISNSNLSQAIEPKLCGDCYFFFQFYWIFQRLCREMIIIPHWNLNLPSWTLFQQLFVVILYTHWLTSPTNNLKLIWSDIYWTYLWSIAWFYTHIYIGPDDFDFDHIYPQSLKLRFSEWYNTFTPFQLTNLSAFTLNFDFLLYSSLFSSLFSSLEHPNVWNWGSWEFYPCDLHCSCEYCSYQILG